MRYFVFLSILSMITNTVNSQQEARLMRFPAVNSNSIVFSYAGDLYIVDKTGGQARRITSGDGYEMFPRFSPDGKWIAFTGQYDGNTEVYLIPSEGGTPKRLTYTATLSRDDISDRMGPNNIVMGWSPDGKIIYRSRGTSFNDLLENFILFLLMAVFRRNYLCQPADSAVLTKMEITGIQQSIPRISHMEILQRWYGRRYKNI